MNRKSLLWGLALGAGLMYVFDPERGRRRRALARDKAVRLAHRTGETLDRTRRDLGNRAQGVVAQLGSMFRQGEVDDEVLIERLRANIGHVTSNPQAIDVQAEGGRVTLSGEVPADEADRLLRRVLSVRGVREVEDRLHITRSATHRASRRAIVH